MRVQLIRRLLCLAALGTAMPAFAADVRIDTRVGVYTDDDHTTVVTPRTGFWFAPDLDTEVRAAYGVDIISSASVDVVTAATGRFVDRRHELTLNASRKVGSLTTFSAHLSGSREDDFASQGFGLTLAQEMARRSTTLLAGFSVMHGVVGAGGTPLSDQSRPIDTFGTQLGLSQILGPRATASLAWEMQRVDGFQASPYRHVDVIGAGETFARHRIPERVPDLRTRHGLALQASWTPTSGIGLHAMTRAYADTWGIRALTAEILARAGMGPSWSVLGRARGHRQTGARFYSPRYERVEAYMSVDRKHAPMRDVLCGLALGWDSAGSNVPRGVQVHGHVDAWWFSWPDHPRLNQRLALLAGVEASLRW